VSPTIDEERVKKVVSIIVAHERPVLGTNEIADRFGISQQAMTRHLNNMSEEGILHTDKIGRVRVWWPTQKGLSYLDSE
jgi:predicted transcriptional regulator